MSVLQTILKCCFGQLHIALLFINIALILKATILHIKTFNIFHYCSDTSDSIKHAKDALTREVLKMEAFLSSRTTPEGAEVVPGNPHKAPRMETQPDSGGSSSSSQSSLKDLFEEILQEHEEERRASSTSTQVQIQTSFTEQTVPCSDSPFHYCQLNLVSHPGCHCCKVSLCSLYQC